LKCEGATIYDQQKINVLIVQGYRQVNGIEKVK
jgi:hypothetical protein